MGGPWFDRGVALLMVLAVAAAAGLEGGVVPAYGGAVLAVTMVVGAAWVWARGVDPLPRVAKVGLLLLAGVLIYQALPIPQGLRALVAPGQAAWIDRVAPEWTGALDPWLEALAGYDVLAAVGAAGPWSHDLLAGSHATLARVGAVAPGPWGWTLGQLLACAVVYLVGARLARSASGARIVLVGVLLLGVAEAIFGLANRSGPSTGVGLKTHYLGSATGTFINRGHFGAFLALAIGSAWGLAAGLFPLLPEEVRRHAKRVRRSSQPPSVFEASGDRLPRLALLGFLVAVLLVALVASQSRGPVLGLAVSGLAVGGWMAWRREERFHLGIALALPVVGGVLASLAFGPIGAFGRFRGVLGSDDVSISSRFAVWTDSLHAWRDAPILGAGLGAWPIVHPLYERADHLYAFSNAHDEPVQILVELGGVGLVAFALVAVATVRGLRGALATVPHDDTTAAGVGALVGVGAVLLQSLGDFPLHIPGVAVPFALLAGIASGALVTPARAGARWPALVAAALAAVLCGRAAADDADFPGTRDERLSERGRVWFEPERAAGTRAGIVTWGEHAAAEVARTPLDPWAHAALAEAEAVLAREAWKAGGSRAVGGAPEDHALRADLALTRALVLRGRDPRVELVVAHTLLVLAAESPTPDAFRARAADVLADAVGRDAWRAEDAFSLAADLPAEALARIDAAATGTPRSQARVHHYFGVALDALGRHTDALAAQQAAIAADPRYGPALFTAGIALRRNGDPTAGDALLRRFLTADERAGGMEGWALLELGELDAAQVRLRRVVAAVPDNRWAWQGLAEIGRRLDDVDDERAALRRLRALDPGDSAVRDRLATLEGAAPER
jgi:O-antigen ligase/tetratricopeptide (TPR) repeat protein